MVWNNSYFLNSTNSGWDGVEGRVVCTDLREGIWLFFLILGSRIEEKSVIVWSHVQSQNTPQS